MLLEMKVPSPGESISEVDIAEWLVNDGDYVEKDQVIAEIDSDKATLELPAEESGEIKILILEGETVSVGDIVCIIDTSVKKAKQQTDQIRHKKIHKKYQKLILILLKLLKKTTPLAAEIIKTE